MPSGLIALADELHITLSAIRALQLQSLRSAAVHQCDITYRQPERSVCLRLVLVFISRHQTTPGRKKNTFEFILFSPHLCFMDSKHFLKPLLVPPCLSARPSTTSHPPALRFLTSCYTIYSIYTHPIKCTQRQRQHWENTETACQQKAVYFTTEHRAKALGNNNNKKEKKNKIKTQKQQKQQQQKKTTATTSLSSSSASVLLAFQSLLPVYLFPSSPLPTPLTFLFCFVFFFPSGCFFFFPPLGHIQCNDDTLQKKRKKIKVEKCKGRLVNDKRYSNVTVTVILLDRVAFFFFFFCIVGLTHSVRQILTVF